MQLIDFILYHYRHRITITLYILFDITLKNFNSVTVEISKCFLLSILLKRIIVHMREIFVLIA